MTRDDLTKKEKAWLRELEAVLAKRPPRLRLQGVDDMLYVIHKDTQKALDAMPHVDRGRTARDVWETHGFCEVNDPKHTYVESGGW